MAVCLLNPFITFPTAGGGVSTDTGWLICTACIDDGGGDTSWTLPSRATADDGSETTNVMDRDEDITNKLFASDFDAVLPDSITSVDGVTFKVQARRTTGDGCKLDNFRMKKNGTLVGSINNFNTNLTASVVDYEIGGASDLWGTTWLYSNINHADTGISFNIEATDDDATPGVDAVWMKVNYTT